MFYDDNIVRNLCADARLEIFYNRVNSLIDVWFKKDSHVLLTKQMETFIIGGGIYGTTSNRVLLEQVQAGGKTKNLLYRIFMPYYKLKTQYPLLEKHKWLTPMFQVVRWCRMVTNKNLKRSINELSIGQKCSKEQIQMAEEFLDNIGLHNKTLCQ